MVIYDGEKLGIINIETNCPMILIKKVTLIFDAVVTSVLYESVSCVRFIKLITQRTVVYTITLKYPVFQKNRRFS